MYYLCMCTVNTCTRSYDNRMQNHTHLNILVSLPRVGEYFSVGASPPFFVGECPNPFLALGIEDDTSTSLSSWEALSFLVSWLVSRSCTATPTSCLTPRVTTPSSLSVVVVATDWLSISSSCSLIMRWMCFNDFSVSRISGLWFFPPLGLGLLSGLKGWVLVLGEALVKGSCGDLNIFGSLDGEVEGSCGDCNIFGSLEGEVLGLVFSLLTGNARVVWVGGFKDVTADGRWLVGGVTTPLLD